MIVQFYKILKMDLFRAFFSIKFLLSVLGSFCCMYIGALIEGGFNLSVIYVFNAVVYGLPFLLTIIFSALPYSKSIFEDMEHNFLNLLICRGGSIKSYTISKCITIILSSMITIILSVFCFLIICRVQLPWIHSNDDTTYEILTAVGGLRYFLLNKKFLLYYFLFALQFSILAAALSLLSALFSLFVSDRMLCLTIPIISFYIISFCLDTIIKSGRADLYNIFMASINLWNNDLMSYIYAILIGTISSIVIIFLINQKIKRKVRTHG